MHSWDFIFRFWFFPGFGFGNKRAIKKFEEVIRLARKNGYNFGDLKKDYSNDSNSKSRDLLIKLNCLSQLKFNFYRFTHLMRLNYKYTLLASILIFLVFLVIKLMLKLF